MILSPRLTKCKDCTTISFLLEKIDRKIFFYSKKMYNNITFMLDKYVDGQSLSDLLHYRRILTYRLHNENYVCNFCLNDILSRVNELTIGQTENCMCENNTVNENLFPYIYKATDGEILNTNNLIGVDYDDPSNIEVLFDNIEGNYIYFVYLASLGSPNRIFTPTSPVNVVTDWNYLPDIILNNQTYKVMRPNYIMTVFTNFKHNFIF